MKKNRFQEENFTASYVVDSSGCIDLDEKKDIERVTDVEILPAGMDFGVHLPDDIQAQIEEAIFDFMAYQCKPPIEDMSKARAPRWSACCMYIGQNVCKRYTRPHGERDKAGRWLPLETAAVDELLPLWAFFCQSYDKNPLEYDFFYFCGLSFSWIYGDDCEGVTRERTALLRKLKVLQERGLTASISDGMRNPTGALAILNHFHGWQKESIVTHQVTVSTISAKDLPKLPQI